MSTRCPRIRTTFVAAVIAATALLSDWTLDTTVALRCIQ